MQLCPVWSYSSTFLEIFHPIANTHNRISILPYWWLSSADDLLCSEEVGSHSSHLALSPVRWYIINDDENGH